MPFFIINWVSVSFLWLFVVSASDSMGVEDFIELSKFDYFISENADDLSIGLVSIPNVRLKMMCPNCIESTSNTIDCWESSLIKADIQMKTKDLEITFPFNISCNALSDERNTHMIPDIETYSGVNNISMMWYKPNKNINYYLVNIMSSSRVYTNTILGKTTYEALNLKEKTWHHICIASIDRKWRTSRFNCKTVLTDFSTTGPVTNVRITPESDRIFISWSRPENEYVRPQGYIIYIQGRTNQMCRVYIIKWQPDIDPASQYSCVKTKTITLPLSSLEIPDLTPNSEFSIEISPFNKNKKSAITYLTIKTKEGESGPVQNLKADLDSDPHYIHISFDAPINPAGIILKYRMRVILKRINICTSSDDVIQEVNTTIKYGYIPKSVLKKCGTYVLEVAPMDGLNIKNWVGITALVPFNYSMDHQSSVSIDTKFVLSNTLIFSLGNLKRDKCEAFGFIVVIKNENDRYNCLTRIISNIDCKELKRKSVKGKCGMKQFIKYDAIPSIYEFPVSNVRRFADEIQRTNNHNTKVPFFRRQSRYKATVYKIANEVTEVKSVIISTDEIKDCFVDCYTIGKLYTGIRSVLNEGSICKEWKNTNYSTNIDLRSNICSSVGNNPPGCFNEDNYWGHCDIPECSSIPSDTDCLQISLKNEELQSLTITLPPYVIQLSNFIPLRYVVLLHNSDHFCEQAILLCRNCMKKYASQIKGLYLSCKSIKEEPSMSLEIKFTDLHQNRYYNVYIATIIGTSTIRNIGLKTAHTILAKPHIPDGINYQSHRLREIEFSWLANNETKSHGFADSYMSFITHRKRKGRFGTIVFGTSVKFSDLEVCTEYCFVLSSENSAGQSGSTNELCTFTLAPKPERSQLADPPSGYMRNQSLSWTYLGSDNCQKSYRLEYRVKFVSNAPTYILTNDTSVLLTDLIPNVIYTVRVRAEGQMKTINNDSIGVFSLPKEFFTGKLQPNLAYYQHNLDLTNKLLNISWEIEQQMQGSIFMYIIQVKNSTKFCMFGVLLACQTCREPWTWNNVRNQYGESLKTLINCTVSMNGTVDANQTSFNFLVKSENQFDSFFVDIYGIDLMGIHLLNKKSDDLQWSKNGNHIIMIVVIVVIFLLLFIILALIKLKRKPTSVNITDNEVKIDESFMMKRTNNPKRTESNKTNVELIREKMILNRHLRRLTDPDLWPVQDFRKINKINISGFSDYYKETIEHESVLLINEYKKLTKASKAQEATLELTFSVGKDSENLKKNQFANILPYDQNRVKVGKKRPPMDYINASYIPFENDETQIEYIAAQGPIEDSLSDFWQMIWEQRIQCIVMLTRTKENDKFKCLQYWPNDTEESASYGNNSQYNVSLVKEDIKEAYIDRELRVVKEKCNECRTIIQLYMHTWPDHSAPNLNFFDKFLFRFHEIINETKLHPYLVHCSAGVGRTGTMICIDRIIKELIRGVKDIGIYDTVLKLRKYRNFIVQRETQYIFIHEYINHFLEKYKKVEGVEDNIYFNDD